MAKSFIDNSAKKLEELIFEYHDFRKDNLTEYKANNLCTNAWHIIDWVFVEFENIHGYDKIGDLRSSLYPRCHSLKIMHDIANASKHKNLDRPKAFIRTTSIHEGDFCKEDFSSDDFDVSRLEIVLEDETTLDFNEEIQNVIEFWKSYFSNDLQIELN
ncbi:hypothetical protein [Flavobacterium sp. DG2-3]|uniref:hypothetical protein n=1 Tax=Flavobacterium sp. DG2-3 TaxID=3068317 RepID=UPI00273FEC70|nr:hypothetical protein [Flavobacterium sp. DG2-3]MDP5198886.1 hypothetical protein [Flavobacterium sp. DG2-3]